MKSSFTWQGAVCLAALMSASSVAADVTADEVWENWQSNLALYGEDGASFGDVARADGQITVSDLVLTMDDSETVITSNVGTIVFVEQGDGTVAVTMQDSYDMTIDVLDDDTTLTLTLTQENLDIRVSGVPEAMNYDVTADSYEMRVADFGDNADVEGDALVKAHGLAGSYQVNAEDGVETSFDFTVGALDLLIDVKEPGSDGYALFSGKMDAMTTTGQIDLPAGADMDDPATFADDFTFSSDTAISGASFIFDVNMDGESANGSLQTGPVNLGGAITTAALTYAVSVAEAAFTAESADMPLPVAFNFALFENILNMPVAASDEPAPFNYSFTLNDLTVNDEIWAMGDPAGAIPRDPASFVFDVSGMAQLFFDLLDPDQEDAMALADVPGEVVSLAVNTIRLSAAGAEVTASGDFTFDNTDLDTFDGIPRPEGELNVGITGANALIDTLIGMGLLPEEQAMMGRMMMGMFTQPVGDDALTSKIEINAEGHVLANGQRIQ